MSGSGSGSGGRAWLAGTPAREAVQSAQTAIAAAGCDTPRLDAELLVAHVLGVSREQLLTDRELLVAGPAVRALQNAVRRRAVEREPLAYIVHSRHFRSLELEVDARALVPRPETELLVGAALALPAGARVLDVGTGSGAVALALKHERPDLRMSASDISADALELARTNAQRLRLDVEFVRADLLEGVPDAFDAIVSNPPYVADGELRALAPEITRHEPRAALSAGADGLAVIRALAQQLRGREHVRTVALEVGEGQARDVQDLLAGAGFASARRLRDLAGIERVLVAERGS